MRPGATGDERGADLTAGKRSSGQSTRSRRTVGCYRRFRTGESVLEMLRRKGESNCRCERRVEVKWMRGGRAKEEKVFGDNALCIGERRPVGTYFAHTNLEVQWIPPQPSPHYTPLAHSVASLQLQLERRHRPDKSVGRRADEILLQCGGESGVRLSCCHVGVKERVMPGSQRCSRKGENSQFSLSVVTNLREWN